MEITFVGGWASDSAQYPVLAGSARVLVPFSGFRPEELPQLIAENSGVLLSWSTGAHMLLKDCLHLFPQFDQVILIAPFLAFTDSFPERLVRRMIAGMAVNPAEVVASFYANCGEERDLAFDESLTPALTEGLEYLISSRFEPEKTVSIDNLTLVHGIQDKIVRGRAFERVKEFFVPGRIVTPDCGHKISEQVLLELIRA
ncbi:hypothetical protein [Maridesulfovibrio sp. FT414]|uniref:hypothetical protein n=1 Tax=Maridesulfovibrio sp. FT414 TaxID=2979469 RepID=UPI003D8097A6